MKPMNVLLITSDQQRWDATGYNSRVLKTPALDGLAQRGIIFDRAYCNHPVCTPSRCSILTGHYGSKSGVTTVGHNLPENYPTLPPIFANAGYMTGLLGKAHFRSCCTEGSFEGLPNVHNEEFFRNWNGPYHCFDYCRMIIGHTTEVYSAGMHYRLFLREKGIDIDKYFGEQFPYPSFGRWELPEEAHPSAWVANETIRAIEMAKNKDKPFFFWTSFPDPHNPCYVPSPWSEMYNPDDMPVYADTLPGEFDDKPPHYRGALQNTPWPGGGQGDDPWVAGVEKPWYTVRSTGYVKHGLEDPKVRQKLITQYYGMISLMDHHMGRIFQSLEKNGMMENTIIVFTSDHGELLGHHGLWWKGLHAYEDSQRVPMVVYHPHCKTPGQRSQALQSLIDYGQTFLNLCGLPIPHGQQSANQSASWLDASVQTRDNCIIEFRPTEGPFMQKTFITDRYKIVFYNRRSYGELYDLQTDPNQIKNLWECPEHQGIRKQLTDHFISAEMEKDGTLLTRTMWA